MIEEKSILHADLCKKPKHKVSIVSSAINDYVRNFLSSNDVLLNTWNGIEHQNALNKFILDKKIKMTDPKKEEKRLEKKLEKKNKIINREKAKQEKKVEKAQSRPKSAFFFFKLEEENKIKESNPSIVKKDIHLELQKRWKDAKSTDRFKYYKELADKESLKIVEKPLNTNARFIDHRVKRS
jgi:hypothetical protein